MKKINVCCFPKPVKENPYHYLLYNNLEKYNIKLKYEFSLTLRNIFLFRNESSIMHIHWMSSILSSLKSTLKFCFLLSIAKIVGYKIIWTAHNLGGHEGKEPWASMGRRYVCFISDAIITHSEYAKNFIKIKYNRENKVFPIAHGSYINWYPNRISKKDARRILGIEDGKLVFLLFGMIKSYKGHNTLLNNIQKLDSDCILLIAGLPADSDISNKIREKSKNDSRIKAHLKFVKDEDVQIFFNASDFAIFPFDTITTSGSLILALSFGLPVIAMNTGFVQELISSKNGALADNIDDLILKMKNAKNFPIASMQEESKRIAENLNWEKSAKKHWEVYSKLLGSFRS